MNDFPAGWIDDPEAVEVIAEQQPYPSFELTPIGGAAIDRPSQVFLWKAYKEFTGHNLPDENQGQIGSCVSFGTEVAIKVTIASQNLSRRASSPIDLVQEEIYGGSRVEIGKGRLGCGDGSIGAWAAELVAKYGVIPRGIWGHYDLSKYSVSRCKEWGQTGIPDDLEPECRKRIVKEITLVKNWEAARTALANGYGIAICSSQGFTMQRDSEGYAKPKGTWNHCMALIGYVEGSRPGGYIKNSWGSNTHTGPLGPGDPPSGGFWADAGVIDSMLRQGDSWAFSSVEGFKAQDIDWSKI